MKGTIFIVSAPSGAGKTTLCRKLIEKIPDITYSISYTTRKARKNEIDGKDYFFISKKKFLDMIKKDEFLEWAEVHGNLYGTHKKQIFDLLNKGIDVILDIDTQGAKKIKALKIMATYIFILPPSMDVLEKRLILRGTESEDGIKKRLIQAKNEIKDYKMYDYVIFNNDLLEAVEQLCCIVIANRLHIEKIDHNFIKNKFLE